MARFPVLGAMVKLLTSTRFAVEGDSMYPTLEHGQYLLVDRLAYLCAPPSRGHLVVLRNPLEPEAHYVKRIVALPGEHLRMDSGCVIIDDRPLEEPYASGLVLAQSPSPSQWLLAEGEYFVLGDSRSDSHDSRAFGPVQTHRITGRAWLRYWPRRAWGRLP